MIATKDQTIVVTGATGLQGGAVTRHLLASGWRVRAITRNPNGTMGKTLDALGAEVVRGDMSDPDTLLPIFEGAYGVFSVQNPIISGIKGEIIQGKNVADVARRAGIQHVIYSSAGPEVRGSGVPSWESKLVIEAYMKGLDLPMTVLRPMAFMELMTEKKFYPAISTWHLMPRLMGNERKLPWVCTDDLGCIVAKAFSEPARFIGRDWQIASDVLSINECRTIYQKVTGSSPASFPMPVWLFERFGLIGKDLSTMWRWLRNADFDMETDTTLAIHPEASSVQAWLVKQTSSRSVQQQIH